jgi:FkbH-like protein
VGEAQYIESLRIQCRVERLTPGSAKLDRVGELFQRTTQFNTTGRKFSSSELAALVGNANDRVFTIHVSDRLGDHGLVGAVVIVEGDIAGFAVSCRVLGMGVEHTILQRVLEEMKDSPLPLRGRIIPTARNIPARNIYRDNGFLEREDGLWEFPKLADTPSA